MRKIAFTFAAMLVAAIVLDRHPDLVRDGVSALPALLSAIYDELKELQILVTGVLAICAAAIGLWGMRQQIAHKEAVIAREREDVTLGRAMILQLALREFSIMLAGLTSDYKFINKALKEYVAAQRDDSTEIAARLTKYLNETPMPKPPELALQSNDFALLGDSLAEEIYWLLADIKLYEEFRFGSAVTEHSKEFVQQNVKRLDKMRQEIAMGAKALAFDLQKLIRERR